MRAPIIALVVGFTAIPMDWRWADANTLRDAFSFALDLPDIIANIVGFLPVGVVLANHGHWRGTAVAGALSVVVEIIQLFSNGRSPSAIDVGTNTVGGAIGIALGAHWSVTRPGLTVGRRGALVAAVLGLAICAMPAMGEFEDAVANLLAPPERPVDERVTVNVARPKGFWNFDAVQGVTVSDQSGSGLHGTLIQWPQLTEGVVGNAVELNGEDQWVELGDPLDLRVAGSLTIAAWIKATAFPKGDAAVVSEQADVGYELDTTIDTGLRTIGFKLTNSRGKRMVRYGRTPLESNRWYHVAGVYDAHAKTIDVYLNGRLDNGCLRGHVTSSQRPSGEKVFIGRRSGRRGFEFAGAIDEVGIFRRPLTPAEIVELAALGTRALLTPEASNADDPDNASRGGSASEGRASEEPTDSRAAGLVLALGMLVAVATIGLLGRPSAVGAVVASLMAGLCVLPLATLQIPPHLDWLVPVLTSVGGAVIAWSVRQPTVVDTER